MERTASTTSSVISRRSAITIPGPSVSVSCVVVSDGSTKAAALGKNSLNSSIALLEKNVFIYAATLSYFCFSDLKSCTMPTTLLFLFVFGLSRCLALRYNIPSIIIFLPALLSACNIFCKS